jgi:hypothetical protein
MTTKKIIKMHIKNGRFSDKVKEGKQDNPAIVKSCDILFDDHYYTHPIQLDIIGSLFANTLKKIPFPIQFQTICEQITRHINTKVSSYQMQDKIKKRPLTNKFVKFKDVITMLKDCSLTCHYCRDPVYILYKHDQEMLQWTLDRLDNSVAHITENVVISCLKCNLKKGRKNEVDFIFTKQLSITKKESEDIEEVKKKDELFENDDTKQINNDLIISDIEYSHDV